jgi:protein TonB
VRLDVLIGRDGRVLNMKLVSGDPDLAKAATMAVSKWRYKPTLLNGNPIEVLTEINVNFTLAAN